MYKQGIKKLTNNDGFPMMLTTTVSFIRDLSNQCSIMGLNEGAMGITSFVNASNETINLIKCYGHIDEAMLKLHYEDFCKPGGARYQTRAMQNNHMMAQCLKNLLTASMAAHIEPYAAQYTFNGMEYAPLKFKIMMRLATIDSVATTEALHANLTNLPHFVTTVNGDIDQINSYFDLNYTQIIGHGSTVNDPISKLFDGYLAIPDYNFKKYIAKKQDDYHDGMLGVNFTYKSLMALATAKFTYLKTCGMWGAKSPEDEAIIAMVAKIKDLKGKLKLTLAVASKQKKDGDKSTGGGKKKTKNKKNTSNKQHQKTDEAWKKILPRMVRPSKRSSRRRLTIGVSITWPGQSTVPRSATLAPLARRQQNQSPMQPPQMPPWSSILPFWHSLLTSRMMNRGACQHVCGD